MIYCRQCIQMIAMYRKQQQERFSRGDFLIENIDIRSIKMILINQYNCILRVLAELNLRRMSSVVIFWKFSSFQMRKTSSFLNENSTQTFALQSQRDSYSRKYTRKWLYCSQTSLWLDTNYTIRFSSGIESPNQIYLLPIPFLSIFYLFLYEFPLDFSWSVHS